MKTHLFKLFLVLILNFIFAWSAEEQQVYIVYLGDLQGGRRSRQQIEDDHLACLLTVKGSVEEAKSSVIYDYTKAIDGFSAVLSPEEARKISEIDGVISVIKDEPLEPQTSRSWDFTSLLESDWNTAQADGLDGLLVKANYGASVTVGVVDSGIWPESASFSDSGMAPVPPSWTGVCQAGVQFTTSHCNRKIIGARYYTRGYEQQFGTVNPAVDYRSARDTTGHGTHVSGIIGGRQVIASSGSYRNASIRGGAPMVRLAVYKVCWRTPPGSDTTNACMGSDIIAGFDDAIGDGVDVISASIGSSSPVPIQQNPNSIASLSAAKHNILVSFSAGNSGPGQGSVNNNIVPWAISVGASSIDRAFPSPLLLGNGIQLQGQSIAPFTGGTAELVYAGDIENPGTTTTATTGQCRPGTLSPTLARGKAVFCMIAASNQSSTEVRRAGGIAAVYRNSRRGLGPSVGGFSLFPETTILNNETNILLNYIRTSQPPTAWFSTPTTLLNAKPAPFVAAFSSRGPVHVEPNILKPDVIAPGLNILAPSSEADSPNNRFEFKSGTSMACPHVSAVAALLRAIHPTWSHSAIRSAIITTAKDSNNLRNTITDEMVNTATPLDYGSGHIQPSKAADPGLVYDNVYIDYLQFLCASIGQTIDPSYRCVGAPGLVSNLNYPSLAIANVQGSVTVARSVTNVGNGGATYTVTVVNPIGYQVQIVPTTLHFSATGQTQRFSITVRALTTAQRNVYRTGYYVLSDGVHQVKSPIVVSTTGNSLLENSTHAELRAAT